MYMYYSGGSAKDSNPYYQTEHFPRLVERVNYYKVQGEGVEIMCEVVDEIVNGIVDDVRRESERNGEIRGAIKGKKVLLWKSWKKWGNFQNGLYRRFRKKRI